MGAIIGDKGFKGWVYEELLPELAAEEKSRLIHPDLTLDEIESQRVSKKGMKHVSWQSGAKLREVAEYFNLGHASSLSCITHLVRKMKHADKEFKRKVDSLIKSIIKKVT